MESAATPVLSMQVHGDGEAQVQFAAREQAADALNWIVDVPALESLLADAVRFQPMIQVVDAPAEAALTVVCEGKASSTRAELGVEFVTDRYQQSALATRVQGTLGHAQVARQWFSGDGILAFLPLGGAAGQQCAVVWSLPPAMAAELQQCDPLDFAAQLQSASHGALGDITLCSDRVVWPLQHGQAHHWCGTFAGGTWALAGDAAHAVHPLAGQGLNLGLGDVDALVALLDARPYWRSVGDLRLLRSYERERKAELAVVGGSGDALQRLFDQTNPFVRNVRNWGMQTFDRSSILKHWVTRRAMGLTPSPPSTSSTASTSSSDRT
jgi:ubiquinone biosynthesis UbiH/UbiF/VisC/COQ6 family hydroxylase